MNVTEFRSHLLTSFFGIAQLFLTYFTVRIYNRPVQVDQARAAMIFAKGTIDYFTFLFSIFRFSSFPHSNISTESPTV